MFQMVRAPEKFGNHCLSYCLLFLRMCEMVAGLGRRHEAFIFTFFPSILKKCDFAKEVEKVCEICRDKEREIAMPDMHSRERISKFANNFDLSYKNHA